MLIFTFIFAILAILVIVVKRPIRAPQGSPEYRLDSRVVAAILALMALSFAVLAWTTGVWFLL